MYNCVLLESWNIAAFEFLHSGSHIAYLWVLLVAWLAELPVYIAVVLTAWHLVRRRDGATAAILCIACASAGLLEHAIARYAYHARPFAAGFGPAMMAHAANNSMPSSHAAFVWTLAAVMAGRKQWPLSMSLALLGLLLAWARVFAGIHWPIDMAGAAVVAIVCACLGCLAPRLWDALSGRLR